MVRLSYGFARPTGGIPNQYQISSWLSSSSFPDTLLRLVCLSTDDQPHKHLLQDTRRSSGCLNTSTNLHARGNLLKSTPGYADVPPPADIQNLESGQVLAVAGMKKAIESKSSPTLCLVVSNPCHLHTAPARHKFFFYR